MGSREGMDNYVRCNMHTKETSNEQKRTVDTGA